MLSLQSLLGRGLFSLTLLLLAVWPVRQDQLAVATGLSLVFLLLAVRFLGRASHLTRVGAERGKAFLNDRICWCGREPLGPFDRDIVGDFSNTDSFSSSRREQVEYTSVPPGLRVRFLNAAASVATWPIF